MKTLMIAATALGLLATVPAFAQDLRFGVGRDGLTVRGDDDRRGGRMQERGFDDRRGRRGDERGYRRAERECRTVTTRRQRPNGTMVVTRERQCS